MRLLLALCALALASTGCESVDRVNRPLPDPFSLLALDGTRIERESFLGRAWVLPIWVPD